MKIKELLFFAMVGTLWASFADTPTITSIAAQQRYPWNGKVDITVTFTGSSNEVAQADCTFAATNSATQAALAVNHVTAEEGARGSGTTWTRHFIWDAAADVGSVKIDDVALTVAAAAGLGGVQLWENGPYWAECNVGATKPEEYGYYFWWGDTVGYKRNANNDGWVSVKDGTSFVFSRANCLTDDKDNSALQSAGYIDSTGNLVAAHDAATAHLGAPWRMPTDAEFQALIDNCATTWTVLNGVYGQLMTGKGAYASKSIFLPAAGQGYDSGLGLPGSLGYYWSSTPDSDASNYAWYLDFDWYNFSRYYIKRCRGQSVRPLRGFADTGASSLCASSHLALDTTSGTRTAAATETIRYSSAWESTESGAIAVVAVNAEVIHSSTGAGSVDWSPTRNGTYTLTHKVMNGAVQVGETLSATFAVAGIYPAAVTISPASSEFEGELKVTLSCATKDATIRYTTDGSEPTMASAAYEEALTLTCSTTVKARAFFENGDASPDTATAIYTLKDPVASDFVVADGVLTAYTGAGGTVAIPDGVTSIGDHAFDGCSSLISVKIPGSVTTISEWAFGDCNSIMSVTIPDSVRSIGDYAFFGCSSLTSVAILNRVTSIGNYAFRGCSSLRKAYIPQSLKGAFDEGKVFYNCSSDLEIVYYKPISGIAENADEESVVAAVEGVGFADAAVKAVIGGSAAQYKAFKSWAGTIAGGEAAVVTSPYAAASYLLGAPALFENKPKVEIATIAVGESGGGEQGQAINVEVVVKDGESAVAVAAEKVAQMFEATSDLGDWNGAAKLAPAVTVSGTDSNGKMSFTVKPGDGKTSQAFLRIRK